MLGRSFWVGIQRLELLTVFQVIAVVSCVLNAIHYWVHVVVVRGVHWVALLGSWFIGCKKAKVIRVAEARARGCV